MVKQVYFDGIVIPHKENALSFVYFILFKHIGHKEWID